MPGRLSVPLSVLDLCPVPTGESTGEALRRSVDLARHVERWGFTRYWVAEHHNMPGIASSAPAVLAGQFAFAYHFSAVNTRPALALYRRTFTPSARMTEPYCLISVSVLCAEDTAAARWLHGSSRLSSPRLRTGRPSTQPSPEEAAGRPYSAGEQPAQSASLSLEGKPEVSGSLTTAEVAKTSAGAVVPARPRGWLLPGRHPCPGASPLGLQVSGKEGTLWIWVWRGAPQSSPAGARESAWP